MNDDKKIKIVRTIALIPFILTFILGLYMAIFHSGSFMGESQSPIMVFAFMVMLSFAQFWLVYLIVIIALIFPTLFIKKMDDYQNLKAIRLISSLPFIGLIIMIFNSIRWGEGIEETINMVIGFFTRTAFGLILVLALIVEVKTCKLISIAESKKKESDNNENTDEIPEHRV